MDSKIYRGFLGSDSDSMLESGTNPGVVGTGLRRKVPRRMHTNVVRVSGGFQMHPCPY